MTQRTPSPTAKSLGNARIRTTRAIAGARISTRATVRASSLVTHTCPPLARTRAVGAAQPGRRYCGDQQQRSADEEQHGRSAARSGSPERGRTRRWLQRGILCQDRSLQLPERGPWLDAELVDQRAASRLVALERVDLTAGAVQREHQLRLEALAPRVLSHQRFELGDQRSVLS